MTNQSNQKVAVDYKGKHFILMDEGETTPEDFVIKYIDIDRLLTDECLLTHVLDCNYYGIPAYIGKDKELSDRIKKIEDSIDKYEQNN